MIARLSAQALAVVSCACAGPLELPEREAPIPSPEPTTIEWPVRLSRSELEAELLPELEFEDKRRKQRVDLKIISRIDHFVRGKGQRVRLTQNGFRIQGVVDYAIEAYKHFIGWIKLASCGDVGKKKTKASSSVEIPVSLDWTDDWQLTPTVGDVQVETRDRCRVTALRIDVSGFANDRIRSFLKERKSKIEDEIADEGDYRPRAEDSWQRLQGRVALQNGLFLDVRPRLAYVTPIRRESDEILRSDIGVIAHPLLHAGEVEAPAPRALPESPTVQGQGGRLRVQPMLAMPYERATRELRKAFEEPFFVLSKYVRLDTESLRVSGHNNWLVLDATVHVSFLKIPVALYGTPKYWKAADLLHVPDLDLYVGQHLLARWLLSRRLEKRLVQALRAQAQWILTADLDQATNLIREGFVNATGGQMRLEDPSFNPVAVHTGERGFSIIVELAATIAPNAP